MTYKHKKMQKSLKLGTKLNQLIAAELPAPCIHRQVSRSAGPCLSTAGHPPPSASSYSPQNWQPSAHKQQQPWCVQGTRLGKDWELYDRCKLDVEES